MTDLLQQVGLLQTRLKHCKTSAAALRGCGKMQRTLDGMWKEGVLEGSERTDWGIVEGKGGLQALGGASGWCG